MPRPPTISKTDLLSKLAEVFRAAGFDGTSMTDLSKATGLSKASLYHHFPGGKTEMAERVLVEEGLRLQQLVLLPLAALDDPFAALRTSLDGVAAFYSGTSPQCMMNSIMLGRGADLFKADVSAAVEVWQSKLSTAYAAAGAPAREADAWAAYALQRIQGALIICRLQSDRKALEQCLAELDGDVSILAA